MTTTIRYEVEMTDVMLDRATLACNVEGITLTTFFESAIRDATLEAEKRSSKVADALRNADEYPIKCLVPTCNRRYRLKMHAVNHLKNSHPERYHEFAARRDGEAPEPAEPNEWTEEELAVTEPIPEEVVPDVIPIADDEVILVEPEPEPESEPEPSFKLGVDPKYIEMDEPRSDKSPERAHPDIPEVSDFSFDVPEL